MAAAHAQAVQTITDLHAAAFAQVSVITTQLDAMVASAANSWLATVEAARAQYDSREQAAWDAYLAAVPPTVGQISLLQQGGQPTQPEQNGPRVKSRPPFIEFFPDILKPIKVTTDPITRKTKIEIPAMMQVNVPPIWIFPPSQLKLGGGNTFEDLPKPGKPRFDPTDNSFKIELIVKW